MIRIPLLDPNAPERFPDPRRALNEPNGLLAFGGDLSCERLLAAYRRGIFPWYSEGEPILWWSPDPRCVFSTSALKANRSLRRTLKDKHWQVSVDRAFRDVMLACAAPRPGQAGTWINPEMVDAYAALHALGHAHSVEVWDDDQLIGGIYGVAVGRMFCGESMFSAVSAGSHLAIVALAQWLREWGYPYIDGQVSNPHLLALGAREMPRTWFLHELHMLSVEDQRSDAWHAVAMQPASSFL